MNKRFDIRKLALGLTVKAALLLSLSQPGGCGLTSPSPAAPPAPPAEIPAALTFPGSVNIGFGTPSEEASLDLVRPLVPIGGEFFDAIQFGFDVNDVASNSVQITLDSLSRLEIPLNPITFTFELGPTEGFFGDGIKIDFSDFNFPGKTEACTGCTCPTGCDTACPTEAPEEALRPVCYRIWRNDAFDDENAFKPLMAGYMTRLPIKDDPDTPEDETNAGNGAFRQRFDDDLEVDNAGAVYNHRITSRPFDKTTDIFGNAVVKTTDTDPGNAVVNLVSVSQKALDGAVNETQVLKTLRHAASLETTVGTVDTEHSLQYIAQFREDADFWSGTLQNNLESVPLNIFRDPPDTPNFTDECAQLSTAVGVEDGVCEDLGINVTDVPFLELVPSTDPSVNLPADFPAIPTF